jgi:outer membrane protein TolC
MKPQPLRLIQVSTALLALGGAPLPAAESLTLRQAVSRAVADSPEARIAAARIAAAEGLLTQARAAFEPQVRLESGYIRTDRPVNVFGMALNQHSFSSSLDFNDVPDADNWAASAQLTWPLYAGGRNTAGRDAALAALNASHHGASIVRQAMTLEVTRTFLMIHKSRALIEAAEAAVVSFDSNLNSARKRLEAGTALKTDALDLEVQLARAREDLARAKNANTLTRQSLAALLGIEAGEVDAGAGAPQFAAPGAGERAKRPEELAAESMELAAAARVREAASGSKPSVNLFGSVEHNRGSQFDGEGTNYTAGIMAQWDIWDGRRTRGRVHEAEAQLTAAREIVRRQRLALTLEAQQARAALREADERLIVSAQSVQLAGESVKITRERFGTGLSLTSQLIDAETALTAARVRRAEAESDRRLAVAALRHALGLPILTAGSK